jgi:hypothetical protein
MKNYLITALLGAASLASAAPTNIAPADNTAELDAQVVSGSRYRMNDWDFASYKGKYALDGGASLTVSAHNHHFYTQISGQQAVEVVAAGPDTFVSRDGRTKVAFRQNANGDLMEVTLSPLAAETLSAR